MNLIDSLYGSNYRGHIALVSLALFVLFHFLFLRATAPYLPEGDEFLRLQRVWTGAEFKNTLTDWGKKNPHAPEIYKRDNLIKLDLAYPLIYACLFAFGYAWARKGARPAGPWDYFFFLAPFFAAVLDYCENGMHFYLLHGVNTSGDVADTNFRDPPVVISAIFSHVKFALFIVGSLAPLAALFLRLRR